MTRERFNYKMTPIRHFKEVIKCLDSYNNFVFAADFKGSFTIFLINEKDIENDEETMISVDYQHESGVDWISHQVRHDSFEVLVLNGAAQIFIYELRQDSFDKFQVAGVASVQLPITNPSNLYLCPLNPDGNQLFISNYPLDGTDFMKDQTICVFDT